MLTYADRLRIRRPGDAKFALGPHIDGGGVERWEDPEFRSFWRSILEGECSWKEHDAWSFGRDGQKLVAKGDLYEAPGGVSSTCASSLSATDIPGCSAPSFARFKAGSR